MQKKQINKTKNCVDFKTKTNLINNINNILH